MFFEIFIGALLLLVGLLTFWLAPRVGPNPIFGVRIGYAFASREIWDRTNRAGGALVAFTGAGVIMLTFAMRMFRLSDSLALPFITGGIVVALISETIWLGLYARRLAKATVVAPALVRIVFRWSYLAPVLVTFALLCAVSLYYYPQLLLGRIATHFDLNDQPNGWMSRNSILLIFVGMGFFFVLINTFVVFLATREPLIVFARWGSRWHMAPDRGLMFTGSALALGNLILVYAIYDISWFELRGSHVMPLAMFVGIALLLIPFVVVLFFILAQRQPHSINL